MTTSITTYTELAAINSVPGGDYLLANNLTTSDADYATVAGPTANSNTGWLPIANTFSGTFDGAGYSIDGIFCDRSGTDYQALFKTGSGCTVTNVKLTNMDITARRYGGGLFSYCVSSEVNVTGTMISGSITAIGLGGDAFCAGICPEADININISKTHIAADISGTGIMCGGLVGWQDTGVCVVIDSYVSGAVGGTSSVGGLIGDTDSASTSFTRCYVSGAISGGSNTGALCGIGSPTATNSFWDITTTGQSTTSGGGTSKTTAEMMQEITFTDWDFDTTWYIDEGVSYPQLRDLETVLNNGGTAITFTNNTQFYWDRIIDGFISIDWFGINGDGSTDYTTEWTAALNFAKTNGDLLLVKQPDVDYVVTLPGDATNISKTEQGIYYHDGSNWQKYENPTVFVNTSSAGDIPLIRSSVGATDLDDTVYQLISAVRLDVAGEFRFKWDTVEGSSGVQVVSRIFKNSVEYGTEHTTNTTTVSEDIGSFAAGDLIELWAKCGSTPLSTKPTCAGFRIFGDDSYISTEIFT